MKSLIPEAWKSMLAPQIQSPEFRALEDFLEQEIHAGNRVYPGKEDRFKALELTPPLSVKVVILGQDPYHGAGQAIGLSFAVPNSLPKKPPSLKNILKELQSDLGHPIPSEASDLSGWANQGVLLLNTVLTVRAETPLSHQNKGWEPFTDSILNALNLIHSPIVFVLWGSHAQKKKALITNPMHSIIETPHPSPLSAYRGFLGSKVFSRINDQLERNGQTQIDWKRISDS